VTSTSQEPIVCECGHIGYLALRENDAPFCRPWESYSLDGFEGGELRIYDYKEKPKDLLARLDPLCPKCGKRGEVTYAPRSYGRPAPF
jgi:hypothetical protein